MPFKDYYAMLGIPSTASAEEIRRSFRRLALKYHPDRNAGSVVAEERFKQINEAYQVLSDPEKRPRYHALYMDYHPSRPYSPPPPPGPATSQHTTTNQPDKEDYDPASWRNDTDKNPYQYVFVTRKKESFTFQPGFIIILVFVIGPFLFNMLACAFSILNILINGPSH